MTNSAQGQLIFQLEFKGFCSTYAVLEVSMLYAMLAKAAASASAVLTFASLSPQSTIFENRGRRACGLA